MPRLSCLTLALCLVAAPFAVAAQERPLTDDEVRDLARREVVWCENWSDDTRDCESLYMLRGGADGALIQSGMFVMSEQPAIRVLVAEVVTLIDGRLCSSGSTDELNIQATPLELTPGFEASAADAPSPAPAGAKASRIWRMIS